MKKYFIIFISLFFSISNLFAQNFMDEDVHIYVKAGSNVFSVVYFGNDEIKAIRLHGYTEEGLKKAATRGDISFNPEYAKFDVNKDYDTSTSTKDVYSWYYHTTTLYGTSNTTTVYYAFPHDRKTMISWSHSSFNNSTKKPDYFVEVDKTRFLPPTVSYDFLED